jgi:hypothetical protein
MTTEQKIQISLLSERVGSFYDELNKSELFLATREDDLGSVIISGNREGLTYLASIILSLATEASEGQHYHFDRSSVLAECQRSLIIQFESIPSGEQ